MKQQEQLNVEEIYNKQVMSVQIPKNQLTFQQTMNSNVMHNLSKYLPASDIKNLRLVGKGMKQKVQSDISKQAKQRVFCESLPQKDYIINNLLDLTNLPDNITNLRISNKIVIDYNNLFRNPKLKCLKVLVLQLNKLKFLPETINNLTNLEILDLRFNKIEFLPENIGYLTKLRKLKLDFNQLKYLPESITNLTNLTHLKLSNNKLKFLPESITNLTNLTFLHITSNQLEFLPETIGKLSNLRVLYLDSNDLEFLPESITNLTNLRFLYLSGNLLQSLPENIGNLTLERLDLKHNRLWFLPLSLIKTKHLTIESSLIQYSISEIILQRPKLVFTLLKLDL